MAADDELDRAIAAAAPRAPRDFGAAVEARLRRRERARGQRVAVAGAFVTVAAAALALLLLRPSPPSPSPSPSPGPAALEAWRVTAARGATLRAGDGTTAPLAPGAALVNGVHISVAPGGEARLARPPATVTLAAESAARVTDDELELERGSARLEGPETRVAVNGTTVTTHGASAAVAVEARRSEMNPIRSTNLMKPVLAGATAATLLAVTVYHGAARVQTPDRRAPVELAQNDRLLVEPELPPLVTRNAAPSENPVVNIPVWREEFDATMNAHLADIRHCYELGLDKAPSLSGKLLLKLRVVRHGNRGAIDDVEILPEGRNVNAPVTDQCVLEAVSRIEPPAPSKGGFEALYPVTFDVKPALDDDMKLLNPRF